MSDRYRHKNTRKSLKVYNNNDAQKPDTINHILKILVLRLRISDITPGFISQSTFSPSCEIRQQIEPPSLPQVHDSTVRWREGKTTFVHAHCVPLEVVTNQLKRLWFPYGTPVHGTRPSQFVMLIQQVPQHIKISSLTPENVSI